MLGSYNDGPANSSASAGPFPMPDDIRPWIIGISVRVAKYMNAPVKLAKKLDNREFPPTARSTHSLGMIPAMEVLPCVEPKRNPAVTTPMANKGRICLANLHEANAHSRFSSSRLSRIRIIDRAVIATIIGTSGANFALQISISARTILAAGSRPQPLTTSESASRNRILRWWGRMPLRTIYRAETHPNRLYGPAPRCCH